MSPSYPLHSVLVRRYSDVGQHEVFSLFSSSLGHFVGTGRGELLGQRPFLPKLGVDDDEEHSLSGNIHQG